MPRKPFFTQAHRMEKSPPNIFGQREKLKTRFSREEIIDLSRAISDLDPPQEVRDEIAGWMASQTDLYKDNEFIRAELRKEFAGWFYNRYRVKLNPDTEILMLPGQREAINLAVLGTVNQGEKILILDPAFPIYRSAASLAQAEIVTLPLLERNDYLPNLNLPKSTLSKAKILLLNYPHNPTTAVADLNFYQEVIKLARKNNIVVINDAAYNEIYYEGFKPPSILQIEGAQNYVLELHTFQFTFNLIGLPLTFAVGGKELLSYLSEIKFNFYSPVADYIYRAGISAIKCYDTVSESMRRAYFKRREQVLSDIQKLGWKAKKPMGTHYVWMEIPKRYRSAGFVQHIMRKTGVILMPGSWFGEYGEGRVRISLTHPEDILKEAFERIKEHGQVFQRKYKGVRN
ncbi:MAG: aminotransferase class I/II-fold pyridoxal phosphate-dependent enzyme [candidate division Zixibacteria bacterium]|nr:aminotransferase class I/II-fold pyridoxal phosphate-dependent enzyme [candidate division Zixibacteria bacterium]